MDLRAEVARRDLDRSHRRTRRGAGAGAAVLTSASAASTAGRLAVLLEQAGVDPGAGLQVVAAARLPSVAIDPTVTLLILRSDDVPEVPLPGRRRAIGPLGVLRAIYPPDQPLEELPQRARRRLADLVDQELFGHDWLIPSAEPLAAMGSPHALPWIVARLREPDGCPWDLQQDHRSLRRFVLEEAYETVDAIERGTPRDLAEELGDVLLQVVLHAQLAAEEETFDLTDVYRSIGVKIVSRHPHVFGATKVAGVHEVMQNWEVIKGAERADREERGAEGRFARLARALPAVPASREIQERAAALGWDWTSIDGVWDKVEEELGELRRATGEEVLHELGDVLFALVNLARWLAMDPEEALRLANRRWIGRFHEVERLAAERGIDLDGLSEAGKQALWDEAKTGRT